MLRYCTNRATDLKCNRSERNIVVDPFFNHQAFRQQLPVNPVFKKIHPLISPSLALLSPLRKLEEPKIKNKQ